MRATLTAALPRACTAGIAPSVAAIEPPTARAEECLKKSRRDGGVAAADEVTGSDMTKISSRGGRLWWELLDYNVLSTEYSVQMPVGWAVSTNHCEPNSV